MKKIKYLGALITSDESMDREVEQRIERESEIIGAIGGTVEKERIGKRCQIESGKCYGVTHLDLWR